MAVAAVGLRLTVVLVCRARRGADTHQLLVHLRGGRAGTIVEERQEVVADEHVLLQRHGPDLGDDHLGVAAHGVQPIAELLGVGHGGAQGDQAHARRQVDDDLFPHGAAEAVGEVVDLVHDDVAQVRSAEESA